MKVLVLGNGAREHALGWRLNQDRGVEVISAPGNAGLETIGETFAIDITDTAAVVDLARQQEVELVVVGPEAPLVAGVVDALEAVEIDAFGPNAAAAQLEGSKLFAKEFMARHRVPTSGFSVFDRAEEAERYILGANRPLVVKADGLAGGKGVTVASSMNEALDAVDRIMRKRTFGSAGDKVVIEERLLGEEISYHIVSDGHRYIPLASAQDHKRAFDGDKGPNTGGMGAYSPPPLVTPEVEVKILKQVIEPTLKGLHADGIAFRGALFVGLMLVGGEPFVLEYNVRFGDPEAETLLTRWRGPILPLFAGAARGDFGSLKPQWEAPAALCVILAAGGYPGVYQKGKVISGLGDAARLSDVHVFHSGTRRQDHHVVTSGGRVIAVTATGETIADAASKAYRAADLIKFEGKHFRSDIGWRARA